MDTLLETLLLTDVDVLVEEDVDKLVLVEVVVD